MREWFTAQELAGLTGLPATVRGVQKAAKRECWKKRKRTKGKGFEYHINSLPEEAQVALALREHRKSPAGSSSAGGSDQQADGRSAPAAPGAAASRGGEAAHRNFDYSSEALWAKFNRSAGTIQEEAKRRLSAIQLALDLKNRGIPARQAWTEAGELVGKSRGAVQRWHKELIHGGYHRTDWLPALAPKYQGRTATADCDPEVWDMIVNDYLRPEAPAAAACIYRARLVAEERGLSMPSDRTLDRWLQPPEFGGKIPAPVRILAREGVDALQRSYPAQRRTRDCLQSMELVNADGHRFDVFCKWPDGSIGRPLMLAWQDVHSGKLLEFEIGRNESSDLVRSSWGRLVTRYGIPKKALLDNGRAFANKFMTGGTGTRFRFKVLETDPIGVFNQMGVDVIWAQPAHGQSKPIERFFGDVAEHISKHPLCHGSYVGNSPNAKPENYGQAAVPIEVFQKLAAQQIAMLNAKPGRTGGVCRGRSFNEVFEAGLEGVVVRKATAEQRRLWMLTAEGVIARKPTGEIHLAGNRYWDEALAPYMGQRLVVRFDPSNLHAGLVVEEASGRVICHAACKDDTGFLDQAAAKAHAKHLADYRKKHRAALKSLESADAAQALRETPQEPEPDRPVDSKVVAPVFGKRVVGSDIDPTEAVEDDARQRSLNRVIEHAFNERFKDQV